MNETGLPNPMARKVPKKMLKPPTYGPRITPYRGATASDNEKLAPGSPTIGKVGTSLNTVYTAANMAAKARVRALNYSMYFLA